MTTKWTRVMALAAIALTVASAGFAQTTGRVQGVARDSEGVPLPGVTITATAAVLPRFVRQWLDGSHRETHALATRHVELAYMASRRRP